MLLICSYSYGNVVTELSGATQLESTDDVFEETVREVGQVDAGPETTTTS